MSPVTPPVTVLGRAPEPGRVKTRLAATVGAALACELHEALALDLLARLAEWQGRRGAPAGSLVLALTGGDEAVARFGDAARRRFGLQVERQSGGDLGDRIREALERRGGEAGDASLVVGTDAPLLTDSLLDGAAAAVAGGQPVLAPSTDGGFSEAIVLSEAATGLFSAVPVAETAVIFWSVLPSTLAAAAAPAGAGPEAEVVAALTLMLLLLVVVVSPGGSSLS